MIASEHPVGQRVSSRIENAAAASGAAIGRADSDGVLRRASVYEHLGEEAVLTFASQVARLAVPKNTQASLSGRRMPVLTNVRGGPGTYMRLPYHDVIKSDVPPEILRDKIVLLGSRDRLDHDYVSTPFARRRDMPGVEFQANSSIPS